MSNNRGTIKEVDDFGVDVTDEASAAAVYRSTATTNAAVNGKPEDVARQVLKIIRARGGGHPQPPVARGARAHVRAVRQPDGDARRPA